MRPDDGFLPWIVRDRNWSRAAVPMAAVLLALGPLVRRGLGKGAFAVYLQLPVYMLHQYEEHGHGAFKAFANREVLRDRGQATDGNIFVTNIVGVWGVDLLTLYRARRRPSSGLLAPYLAITNSLLHLVPAVRTRRYNPGAWTAGTLLLPAGVWGAVTITRASSASRRDHLRALAGAIGLHLVVIVLMLTSRPEPEEREG